MRSNFINRYQVDPLGVNRTVMKITAQEEYGLRILLRIARCNDRNGMSIPQLSEAEGLVSGLCCQANPQASFSWIY